jgi:hypothetical protein
MLDLDFPTKGGEMKKTLAYNILIILAFVGGLYSGNYKVDSFSINQIYLHSYLDIIPTVLSLKRLRENRFSETIKHSKRISF